MNNLNEHPFSEPSTQHKARFRIATKYIGDEETEKKVRSKVPFLATDIVYLDISTQETFEQSKEFILKACDERAVFLTRSLEERMSNFNEYELLSIKVLRSKGFYEVFPGTWRLRAKHLGDVCK